MIVFLIVVAIILFIVGFCCGRSKANVEQKEINNAIIEKNKQLDNETNQKQKRLQELNNELALFLEEIRKTELAAQNTQQQKVIALNQEFSNKEKEQAIRLEQLNENYERIRCERISKENKALSDYRATKLKAIENDAEELKQELTTKQLIAEQEYQQFKSTIEELKKSRDALIEAAKREEEIKLKAEFYKIQLPPQNLEDIKILRTIENRLNNREPLYKLIWTVFYMAPTKEMLNRIIGAEKASGIYKITNLTNKKVYIGQSVDLHTRITNHIKSSLGIGTIAHQTVHDAMAADGLENFTFEIVEKCSKEQLNTKEKLWIETYSSDKNGYNKTSGGS